MKKASLSILKIGFFISLIAAIAGATFFIIVWNIAIPDVTTLLSRKVIESTKIYDRTGKILLYDIHGPTQRTILSSTDIPDHMRNASIAIEDKNFYSHRGISITSIIRAFLVNVRHGTLTQGQGGSTITQQLVKNALLVSEKTLWRKIKEVALALKIERRHTKEEILTIYLNEIPYGSSAYGIESATQTFFGYSAKELTLAQSAYLASLPKAPTYFSPYGSRRDELDARKNLVLKRMLELNFISDEEYSSALEEKVAFLPSSQGTIRAPHFVMFVREYLAQKYGEIAIEQAGLKVITTLDFKLQVAAEEIIKRKVEENTKKFNAKNAGLIAINPKTGEILTMVGSKDFFDIENEGNFNVTTALRQPGSAIKPFIYAQAFLKQYGPNSTVFDVPTEFNPLCSPEGEPPENYPEEEKEGLCYHPRNFDNKFRGPVSFREALAQSINVPSVKVLYLAGLLDSLQLARQMGLSTLTDPDRYGLTLVLGGGEVKLIELVSAYGVFANKGMRVPSTPILKIENSKGVVLEELKPDPQQVLDSNIALMITDILSDNEARTPAFGRYSALYFPERSVAAKTGTTNDFRDALIVGFTPSIVVGAWAGNNDNSSMEKRVAGFIIAPLWNEFMQEAFKTLPIESFGKPKIPDADKPILKGVWRGGITFKIDSISKKRATEFTPLDLIEEKVVQQVRSILYWVNKKEPLGPSPKSDSKDSQFKNWEISVQKWARENGFTDENPEKVIPKESDDVHIPSKFPSLSLSESNIRTTEDALVIIEARAKGTFKITQLDFFFNGVLINSTRKPYYRLRINLQELDNVRENNRLTVRVYDSVGNTTEGEVAIYVTTPFSTDL